MLVFTACDPMEDVYEELDSLEGSFKKEGLVLKLVDADYKTSNKFYASEEAAVAAIPAILQSKFPQLGNGSKVKVTFNLASPTAANNVVSGWSKYTVSDEDYLANGFKYKNFDSPDDMITFLNAKYPDAADNQLVVLTYQYYSGTTSTVTDSFYFVDGAWVNAYHVTPENYDAVGSGRFDNFESKDDALLPDYFNRFLSDVIYSAKEGDVQYVSYTYYGGGTNQKITAMVFNGTRWIAAPATQEATIQFGKKNGTWVPDLTKSYTLVAADYTWIASQPALGTTDQLKNLGDFGNFYQSWNGSPNYWSNNNIILALGGLLKHKFPNEEVGQKYSVTYAYYASGNKTNTVILIKRASGEWEIPNPDEL